jgi:stalled ribosome rescue protein Dom34
MKTKRILGIWMDHSTAQLSELSNGKFMTETIESKPKSLVNKQDLYYKDESHVLNKEQNELAAYYKKLGDAILNYEEVILFGPTEAKNELVNSLRDNHLFDKIKIVVKPADKMTESEQHEFLKEFMDPSGNHLRVVR